jgi:hypothetical protein
MSSVQHEVYGNTYQFGKLSAMEQFHVMRRLASVSSGLGEGVMRLKNSGGAVELLKDGSKAMGVVAPLLEAIGRMSNEDSEYVINTCLKVVRRQQGPAWSQVQASPGVLMFPDIGMTAMVALVWRTLEFNLGGFFSELLSVFPAMGVEE